MTETRVALLAVIVENPEITEKMNAILHEYSEHIIGRMGIPYRRRGINVISIGAGRKARQAGGPDCEGSIFKSYIPDVLK